ncbi:hypothetical protein CesoFtcFv8_008197 [Champsocephalus esox]|uniref:Uncharacterized protein n=1 Tax=Champsocephalus esox TaxID=159716 RepID=A0AAN8C820_9TELE|nr:hypothetical protein CesoFtcFv8_008197 [Champsocephalus esox]
MAHRYILHPSGREEALLLSVSGERAPGPGEREGGEPGREPGGEPGLWEEVRGGSGRSNHSKQRGERGEDSRKEGPQSGEERLEDRLPCADQSASREGIRAERQAGGSAAAAAAAAAGNDGKESALPSSSSSSSPPPKSPPLPSPPPSPAVCITNIRAKHDGKCFE